MKIASSPDLPQFSLLTLALMQAFGKGKNRAIIILATLAMSTYFFTAHVLCAVKVTFILLVLSVIYKIITKRIKIANEPPLPSTIKAHIYENNADQLRDKLSAIMNKYNRIGVDLLSLIQKTQDHLSPEQKILIATVEDVSNNTVKAVASIFIAKKFVTFASITTLPFLGGVGFTFDKDQQQEASNMVTDKQCLRAISEQLCQVYPSVQVFAIPLPIQYKASATFTTLPITSAFHVLNIEQYKTFEDYKKTLSQGMKRSVNNNVNKMKKAGYKIKVYARECSVAAEENKRPYEYSTSIESAFIELSIKKGNIKAINFGFTKDELKQKFGCHNELFVNHVQMCTPILSSLQHVLEGTFLSS